MNLKQMMGRKVSVSRRVSDDYSYPKEWDDEFKYDVNNGLYHYTMVAENLKNGYRSKYEIGGYSDTIEECLEQAETAGMEMFNKWKTNKYWVTGTSKIRVEIKDNETNSMQDYFVIKQDKNGGGYITYMDSSRNRLIDSRRVSDSNYMYADNLSLDAEYVIIGQVIGDVLEEMFAEHSVVVLKDFLRALNLEKGESEADDFEVQHWGDSTYTIYFYKNGTDLASISFNIIRFVNKDFSDKILSYFE